ncbi:MAG: RIP metalloprotease RseP, partial [Muribaculaceae bacterium]|nr:RIP metalloprotease RseP [Muribaculaceae bacterium]
RMFGIKVNRFYLFFNPKFSLLKYDPMKGTLKLVAYDDKAGEEKALRTFRVGKPRTPRADGKPTWRDTIYGLGWLPLGGYCDIAGMVDETKSTKDLTSEAQPWEFRSKAAYKRLLVMVAGVLFNFLLAIAIYIGIAVHWGDDYVPYSAMKEGLDFSEEMQDAGFRTGDKLLTLDSEPIDAKDYNTLWKMIQPGARIGVQRGDSALTIEIGDQLLRSIATKGKDYRAMMIRVPVYVASTVAGEAADKAGLKPGDRILKVGADTTPAITEFRPALMANKGKETKLMIERDGDILTVPVHIGDSGLLGIQMVSPNEIFETEHISYDIFHAVPRGWEIGTGQLKSYVSSLGLIFTKEGAQSVGGFGTLGSLFPEKWNWYSFWQITAFLSVILAFMNVIPIPALDGGYILFLLVEMITRRRMSERFIEIANTIGMGFLLLLLVYANFNDIYRMLLK